MHPWPLHYFHALDFVLRGVVPIPTCLVTGQRRTKTYLGGYRVNQDLSKSQ